MAAPSLREAIAQALRMERQACDYYSAIANQSRNALLWHPTESRARSGEICGA